MPTYKEKEAQIVEQLRKGDLRLPPEVLWLIVHFLNNRIQLITLPLQTLERHVENLNESQKQKLGNIKKQVTEIESFLKELGDLHA